MIRKNVIFLCVHNSSRSQMGEALLRHYAGDRYNVVSAGMKIDRVHPLAVKVLEEKGIDTSGLESQSIREYMGRMKFEHAIIVCRTMEADCPSFSADARYTHRWIVDDPAAVQGTDQEKIQAFRDALNKIETRMKLWLEEASEMERQFSV
jgi:arsenate reductase (thioredoxin)